MKLLLENWRKLLEGEVIDFPMQPSVSEEDIQRIISLEADVENLLIEFYGNISRIPLEVNEALEALVDAAEESLKE